MDFTQRHNKTFIMRADHKQITESTRGVYRTHGSKSSGSDRTSGISRSGRPPPGCSKVIEVILSQVEGLLTTDSSRLTGPPAPDGQLGADDIIGRT